MHGMRKDGLLDRIREGEMTMRKMLLLCLAGCHTPPAAPAPAGTWIVTELEGQVSIAWVRPDGDPVEVEADTWYSGELAIVEVRVSSPEPDRRYRFFAEPLTPGLTAVSPLEMAAAESVRFEFRKSFPGRAEVKVWATHD